MKGTLNSYIALWRCLARKCHYVSEADVRTIRRRIDGEGLRFLTEYLPRLGADVVASLPTGQLQVTARFGLKRGTRLPKFLFKLFQQAYTRDGRLRQQPIMGIASTLKQLRQLTQLCYKLEVDNEEATGTTLADFVKRDHALCADHLDRSQEKKILSRLLAGVDPQGITPRHGNGATACRTPNRDKWHSFRYIPRLDVVFPYSEYFFVSPTHVCDELSKLEQAEVVDPPARVTTVPKDSRGPRVISMEPRELQFIQQGLMRLLYRTVESHPLTAGYVNFTDQTINRELARAGSITGSLSTIDLREASDRVTLDLVSKIFPPNWVEALTATRSRWTEMPDGRLIELKKFAPMGSACCFPIEALTFWALLRVRLRGPVWVYGDDIICETVEYDQAVSVLNAAGMEVNEAKSYHTGFFRESCGGDYFHGHDIGYVKLRKPLDHRNALELCAFVNNMTKEWGEDPLLAQLIESVSQRIFPRQHISAIAQMEPLVIYSDHTSGNVLFKRRWNKSYQRYEYCCPVFKVRNVHYRKATKFHWCEMLRSLCTNDSEGRNGVYAAPNGSIKTGWKPLRLAEDA